MPLRSIAYCENRYTNKKYFAKAKRNFLAEKSRFAHSNVQGNYFAFRS